MEIGPLEPINSTIGQKSDPDHQLKIAKEFEMSFLAEMLKYSGINKTSETFGGGAGEEAFSSMLNDAYADALVESGGIGIAELVYQSITEKIEKS
jgi:Rod binding domain-containing protein